jgi:hypothetical protein
MHVPLMDPLHRSGNDRIIRGVFQGQNRLDGFHTPVHGKKGEKMKRTLIAAVLLLVAFAVPALATDGGQPPTVPGQTFEQRQANILKMIDERIAGMQEGKTCIQAAKNDDDLRACREKHRSEMREKYGKMGPPGGMMGGPQGGTGGPKGQ